MPFDLLLDRYREVYRILAPELHHDAVIIILFQDVDNILELHRLKKEPVRGVKVRGYRLGIVIDNMDLNTFIAKRLHRVDRTVVELDALADG
jgi:hypothetical protein